MQARKPHCLRRLLRDQRGLTTVEYAICLCLIAVVSVATWQKFGSKIASKLVDANSRISAELDK